MPRLVLATILTVVLAATGAYAGAAAQADMQILLDTIRANRKALVAANLTLSDDEAKAFWPLYDTYQTELNGVQDRGVKVIEEYTASFKTLSNEQAMTLADQWLAAEADRVKIRRDYLPQFAKILPGRKVARFYQIENKMDAVIRYDLAEEIPVVGE